MKLAFTGTIKDGGLHIIHREEFDRQISALSGDVIIEVSKKRKKRSNQQSRYYWGALVPICQDILKECGYLFTPEQCHDFLKANFNTKPLINEKTGEAHHVPMTTTTLTTVEFEEYMERIRVWAFDFAGVTIPLPNEQADIMFANYDKEHDLIIIQKEQ